MRLLHTTTRTVKDFPEKAIPDYAILSHTWGKHEVSFQDLLKSDHDHKQHPGFSKIEGCCALAASEGWEYIWIDTCCIDKTSSAELSEAINSMYQWYRYAKVCYVYLSDICLEEAHDDRKYEGCSHSHTGPDGLESLAYPMASRNNVQIIASSDASRPKLLVEDTEVSTSEVEMFDEDASDEDHRDEEDSDECDTADDSTSGDSEYSEDDASTDDVSDQDGSDALSPEENRQFFQHLGRSRWFKRGWTLQELLAPREVVFYDHCWTEMGTKRSLRDGISQITRIQTEYMMNPLDASIAAKMSWAASRDTTKQEDLAYCLMGLFEVNMPLLYGEGSSAFQRLQHEIINQSSDESIFAWDDGLYRSGMFAKSPTVFAGSGDIVPIEVENLQRPPYNKTSKGLAIDVLVRPEIFDDPQSNSLIVYLRCVRKADDQKLVALSLTRQSPSVFLRSRSPEYRLMSSMSSMSFYDKHDLDASGFEFRKIYVSDHSKFTEHYTRPYYRPYHSELYFRPSPSFLQKFSFTHYLNYSTGRQLSTWDYMHTYPGISAFAFQNNNNSEKFMLLFTSDGNGPNCIIETAILLLRAGSSVESIKGTHLSLKARSAILHSDRLSKRLQHGTIISVSLRPRGRSEEDLQDEAVKLSRPYYVDLHMR